MQLLKGKAVADAHKAILVKQLEQAKAQNDSITLAIVLVAGDEASQMYATFMKKTAEKIGFVAQIHTLENTVSEDEVIALIKKLSADDNVHGILPMMPLPKHMDQRKVLAHLNPKKDVDGLTVANIGLLASGESGFVPCTPLACLAILDYYNISLEGKNVVVLGRSNVVGKPVARLLIGRNATVTICHSRTKDLANIVAKADIVVAAIGKANFVTADMLKEGAVVIDVGINSLNGKTVGDVDFDNVAEKVSAITPVPGGVGSVTTTMMLESLYKAYHNLKV